MPATDEVTLRVPAELLSQCEKILHVLGLSADEAVRLFLAQVSLHRGLPFAVALPPETSAEQDNLLDPAAVRQATLDSFFGNEPGYNTSAR